MPIEIDEEIRVFSEREFHSVAEKVIGLVFGVHNDLGRLMDEKIYKQAVRKRCEQAGIIPALHEVQIKVRHHDFEKAYYMDLLIAFGLMVEAKTVEKLSKAHHAQALHYLMLAGMHHGLLVNLRTGKVEKEFISTTLDLSERRRFTIHDTGWESFNEASRKFRAILLELLHDWGAFLQTTLYREAVVHFFGGPEVALRQISVFDSDIPLGTHEVCLLADNTALALTALKSGKDAMKDHLQRFLGHTKLSRVQWVNMTTTTLNSKR